MIVFGFELHNVQVDAICTLFYKRKDLLLLAKTVLGKSLIFQFIPFLTSIPGVILMLISLKLLQVEQSEIINCIPYGKSIILNRRFNALSEPIGELGQNRSVC